MHVDHSQAGDREQVAGKDAAVRRDDTKVGVESLKIGRKVGVLQPRRLQHRRRQRQCRGLHLGRLDAMPAASRAVRLRHDTRDDVARGRQRLERGHRKCGRAEEDHSHRRYHFPVRCSFRIFLTMRSRLRPRR